MLKLNYYSHLLLICKYKLIINLSIYLVIYYFLTNNQIIYCMTEDTNVPTFSEALIALQPNIETKTTLSKELNYTLSSLNEKIKELELQLDNLTKENEKLEKLLEESGYLNDMDGDDYPGVYDEWFRKSDDDPRW